MSERSCVVCGGSMEGRRRHARCCGGACRAELSRLRRILAGRQADGYGSLSDMLSRRRKRTQRRSEPVG